MKIKLSKIAMRYFVLSALQVAILPFAHAGFQCSPQALTQVEADCRQAFQDRAAMLGGGESGDISSGAAQQVVAAQMGKAQLQDQRKYCNCAVAKCNKSCVDPATGKTPWAAVDAIGSPMSSGGSGKSNWVHVSVNNLMPKTECDARVDKMLGTADQLGQNLDQAESQGMSTLSASTGGNPMVMASLLAAAAGVLTGQGGGADKAQATATATGSDSLRPTVQDTSPTAPAMGATLQPYPTAGSGGADQVQVSTGYEGINPQPVSGVGSSQVVGAGGVVGSDGIVGSTPPAVTGPRPGGSDTVSLGFGNSNGTNQGQGQGQDQLHVAVGGTDNGSDVVQVQPDNGTDQLQVNVQSYRTMSRSGLGAYSSSTSSAGRMGRTVASIERDATQGSAKVIMGISPQYGPTLFRISSNVYKEHCRSGGFNCQNGQAP